MEYLNYLDDEPDLLEDDLEVLDFVEAGVPRQIYNRSNYFEEMDPLGFFRRFRLHKETVLNILRQIENELEYPHNRNNSVSPINQLLCCLRYYASSGHLQQVADFMGMHRSTACRIISRVSRVIATLFPQYVKMPEENIVIQTQNKFYNMARFPRVIGVVDGTHVRIQSSGGDNAEIYRNRKGYYSLNVQVVGNADLKFIDVVERWPGSSHDATIFGHSNLRIRFEAGQFPNSVLLGDSGYPLRNYLLTPLMNPATRAEQLYNESLVRTRNTIERIIGIWKRRFPVVAYGLRLSLETIKAIIIATAVLHNIAREMNEPEPPPPENIDINELNYLIETQNIEIPAVRNINLNNVQQEIINFFRDL